MREFTSKTGWVPRGAYENVKAIDPNATILVAGRHSVKVAYSATKSAIEQLIIGRG